MVKFVVSRGVILAFPLSLIVDVRHEKRRSRAHVFFVFSKGDSF